MNQTLVTQKNNENDQNDQSDIKIPANISLTNIKLPNQWILYLYDKHLFKKMANRSNFQANPYKELCTIGTVNDLVYILQLMEVKVESKLKTDFINNDKINLDVNDYIIMKKGIKPIWEDPKNCDGGTFSIKMHHTKGYDIWSMFLMYMLGETLTTEMCYINGITVSYISDAYNFHNQPLSNHNSFTLIKIWDGKIDRTRDQFVNILPVELLEKIKSESLMYSKHILKKGYEVNIYEKISDTKKNSYGGRGGFINKKYRNK